jgi:hypothetical protein
LNLTLYTKVFILKAINLLNKTTIKSFIVNINSNNIDKDISVFIILKKSNKTFIDRLKKLSELSKNGTKTPIPSISNNPMISTIKNNG